MAPAAVSATHRAPSAQGYRDVYATTGVSAPERDLVAAAGCQAPPAVPASATFNQLSALRQRVQTSLDGCAARIETLNRMQATLGSEITADVHRIANEKLLLAGLARVLYRQPQSPLVALTTSHSLGDFFTQWSDMQSAAARARTVSDQLAADQSRLQVQQAQVTAARNEVVGVRASLQAASTRISQVEASLLAYSGPRVPSAFVMPAGPAAIIQDIEDAFNPLGQTAVQWALRVAKCESGYNPNAVNAWSGTEGLFQFEPSTWRGTPYGRDNVFDPKYNSLAAAWLYQRSGPGQWQCS